MMKQSMKGCNCVNCRQIRRNSKTKENNMRLTCKLELVKSQTTLADLEPGVVAETNLGIRWRDGNDFVLGISAGYPIVMNSNGNGFGPKASSYTIIKVLGKINMEFNDV